MSLKNREKQTILLTDKLAEKAARTSNMLLVLMLFLQLILPVAIYADASEDDAMEPEIEEVQSEDNIESPMTLMETDGDDTDGSETEETTPVTPEIPDEAEEAPPADDVVTEPVDEPEPEANSPPPAPEEPIEEAEPAPEVEEDVEEPEEEEVEEEAEEEATTLTFEADGIRVEVFGEAGVIPKGTELSLEPFSKEEADIYLAAVEENTDVLMGYVTLFNIHLLDEAGNKIQPNGEVSVNFYGLDHIKPSDDVFVYHAEVAQGRRMASASSNVMLEDFTPNVMLEDFTPNVESGKISFDTNHFSIYIVGIDTRHESLSNRYQMYIGDTVQLEERDNYSSNRNWSQEGNSVEITANGSKVTVTAVRAGDSNVRYHTGYTWVIIPTYNNFYIRVNQRSTNDTLTQAVPPFTDPDALPPGTVAAEKTARWVDYTNRIAEINLSVEGMPTVAGSDVILVMDVSGSMSTSNRIGTAQQASNAFINGLLGDGNPLNNRVAFIPFSHGSNSGGYSDTEVANATSGSKNFSYDASLLANYVNQTVADGGTNYTAALQKALNYSNSRLQGEESRPLYVVFMSDGQPGLSGNSPESTSWNGTNQANALKNMGATIYTVGIQLGSATGALQNISSTVNGQLLYQGVSNMNQLQPVLETIAGEIKIAGTNAVFKDYLSEYFEYYNQAPYNRGDGTHNNGVVSISVGNINEDAKTYKIYVQLKPKYRLEEKSYPTNSDIHLDYTDVDDEAAHKYKDEIGHPHLSVGYGTINVRYVLVNESGQYITRDTGVEVEPQFRQYVPTQNHSHLFEHNGDNTHLEVMETYTVSPTVPPGYTLYSPGETINQEVTWDNTNPTVEFKVVQAPEAIPDEPLIRIGKTFSGLTQEQIAQLTDFKITITSQSDPTRTEDLFLADAVRTEETNGDITYSWVLDGWPPGTYTVTESGEELTNYEVIIENDGTVTTVPAEINWITALWKKPNTQTNNDLTDGGNYTIPNIIATKLTTGEGVFVWTEKRLSASERLAVVQALSGFNELGLTINNGFWYSGEDIEGTDFYFRGDQIQYNFDTGNLHIPEPKQWALIISGEYEFVGGDPADIAVKNSYTLNAVDVTIEKEVTGNLGDRKGEFEFTVIIDGDEDNPEIFNLSHGGSITLEDIPANAVLTLMEDARDHDVTVTINSSEIFAQEGKFIINLAELTGEDITIEVTNHRNISIDTGVTLDSLLYILILLGAVFGLAIKVIPKKNYE